MDTTYIQQNFLIDEEEFENDDQYEQDAGDKNDDGYQVNGVTPTKKQRFRISNIRVNLIEEQEFGDGVKINVIKFVEVDKNDENIY